MKIKRLPISRRRCHGQNRNLGIVAVEAALCMLIIVPIMFATLEICAGYYLQESLTIAAYEGAKTGSRANSTPEQVRTYVSELLAERGVNIPASGIQITPASFDARRRMEPVRVTVTCSTGGNSLFVFDHLAGRNVSAFIEFPFETGLPPFDLNN